MATENTETVWAFTRSKYRKSVLLWPCPHVKVSIHATSTIKYMAGNYVLEVELTKMYNFAQVKIMW